MGKDNVVFLEVIEWFDESGKELLYRIPEKGSEEIKWGAPMTVREHQSVIFTISCTTNGFMMNEDIFQLLLLSHSFIQPVSKRLYHINNF